MTTFSVIIPAFNRADALRACVESVQRQSAPASEIIVVDDASTDDMDAVFAHLTHSNVSVIRHDENRGPSAARNLGATSSTSHWLVFLDADDELLPTALATFADAARRGCALVRATSLRPQDGQPDLVQAGFLAGTFAVRRSVFESIGGYDEELRFGENSELLTRLEDEVPHQGLTQCEIDDPTVSLRSVGRSRPYDEVRMRAAIHILDKQADRLAGLPQERAKHESIVAVNAARVRQFGVARRYAWRALRSEPTNPRHYGRFALVLAGPLASRYWNRLDRRS